MAITPDRTRKYREALRNIMTIISEEFGETFPGDEPWLDAIIQTYVTLGWFDCDTNELPAYRSENPELELEPESGRPHSITITNSSLQITGAGWYRTTSGNKAYIQELVPMGWKGYIDTAVTHIDNRWTSAGEDIDGYRPWDLVAKLD